MDDDKIDIYLYSDVGQDATLDTLARLPLYTAAGEVLPLGAVAEHHGDRQQQRGAPGKWPPHGHPQYHSPREIPLETGVARVRSEVVDYLRERGAIPADVNVAISGAADQLDATARRCWATTWLPC